MPLYNLAQFQSLVRAGNWGYLNLKRPSDTREKLNWSDDDVSAMLCGLTAVDFQKTVRDCKLRNLPGIEFVHADQYEIHWDDANRVRSSHPRLGTISLSLKIAIIDNCAGQFSGVVTLHTSGMP